MDVEIRGADTVILENGQPSLVTGALELIQQLNIGLKVTKGCFPYDRELGFFGELNRDISSLSGSTVESMINENLVNSDFYCRVRSIEKTPFYSLIHVTLSNDYNQYDAEVRYYG